MPALAAWFDARAHAGSLVEYLRGFALTVAAMATPEALERVAFEAAEDALAEGCVLAEFRIAPLLFEAHGVAGDVAVAGLLAGLARSRLPSGLIVCAMRQLPPAQTVRAAELALRWQGRGVVGFDLAGPEAGWPAGRARAALALVREAGLPLTLHAGEADAAERVLEPAAWVRAASATACTWPTRWHDPARAASGGRGQGAAACTWRSAPPATCTPVPRRRWPRTPSRAVAGRRVLELPHRQPADVGGGIVPAPAGPRRGARPHRRLGAHPRPGAVLMRPASHPRPAC
jgi:hypothetical protein